MTRRGYLAAPNPALTEPCAQPGCGDAEGVHLLCGCASTHHGRPCACPGFAIEAPQCPHCGRYFDAVWKFDLHMKVLRRFDLRCWAAERQQERDTEARRQTRAFLDRAAGIR